MADVMPEERKDERLVLLCSKPELESFERFRAEQKIPTKAELMRALIFAPIEEWEGRKNGKAKASGA